MEKDISVPNVFISFRFKNTDHSHLYYAKLFESHFLDRGLRRIISSSARMDGLLNVNKKSFFNLKIPVPSPPEQQKIAEFLVSIDAKIAFASKELTLAQNFKKGLLQKMFI